MGIQLQPQENFTIVRQLSDPSDLNTYYVQAVVRNSLDDTVLATVKLTDKGSRRFTKLYQIPADISGLGFFIDITSSVYTDSGYTTKSQNYGEENNQYLVYNRQKSSGGGGGGGGSDIDYKKITKIVDKAVKNIEAPEIKMEKAEPVDLSPVMRELTTLKEAVMAIEIPENEEVDLSPVMEAIETAKLHVTDRIHALPEPKEVDFEPVLEAMKGIDSAKIQENSGKLADAIEEIKKTLSDEHITAFSSQLDEIKKRIYEFLVSVRDKTGEDAKEKPLTGFAARASKLLS